MLSLNFWFSLRPAPLFSSSEIIMLSIFSAFIVISIIFRALKMSKQTDAFLKPRLERFYRLFITAGCVGLIILFFSYERVYLLGARFWYLFLATGFLTWLGFIIYDIWKNIPRERNEQKKKEQFEKYLPKKK